MKAEPPDIDKGLPQPSTPTASDSSSIAESSTAVESSHEGSPVSTTASSVAVGKHKTKGKQEDTANKTPRSSAENLVGKINNLVTTDLNNIVDGRDFLMICESEILAWNVRDLQNFPLVPYTPLQIGVCTWFLYRILGWRYDPYSSTDADFTCRQCFGWPCCYGSFVPVARVSGEQNTVRPND